MVSESCAKGSPSTLDNFSSISLQSSLYQSRQQTVVFTWRPTTRVMVLSTHLIRKSNLIKLFGQIHCTALISQSISSWLLGYVTLEKLSLEDLIEWCIKKTPLVYKYTPPVAKTQMIYGLFDQFNGPDFSSFYLNSCTNTCNTYTCWRNTVSSIMVGSLLPYEPPSPLLNFTNIHFNQVCHNLTKYLTILIQKLWDPFAQLIRVATDTLSHSLTNTHEHSPLPHLPQIWWLQFFFFFLRICGWSRKEHWPPTMHSADWLWRLVLFCNIPSLCRYARHQARARPC